MIPIPGHCRFRYRDNDGQMELVAWQNNQWQIQWISGVTTTDVGECELQVGVVTSHVSNVVRACQLIPVLIGHQQFYDNRQEVSQWRGPGDASAAGREMCSVISIWHH
jgi:hypothetical protein